MEFMLIELEKQVSFEKEQKELLFGLYTEPFLTQRLFQTLQL